MYNKIVSLYDKEKNKLMNLPVRVISSMRKFWCRFNQSIENRVVSRFPKQGRLGTVSEVYMLIRDTISYLIEDLELKFRGLR